jgi:hypothetical protein
MTRIIFPNPMPKQHVLVGPDPESTFWGETPGPSLSMAQKCSKVKDVFLQEHLVILAVEN